MRLRKGRMRMMRGEGSWTCRALRLGRDRGVGGLGSVGR